MKKLLIPIVLALVGLAGGLFAGHAMKPAPEPEEGEAQEAAAPEPAPAVAEENPGEFVKLERQFVVPVIADEKVSSLIVLQMAVEVTGGGSAPVFDREPKLRDEFLRVLFLHAQSGGFGGAFTEPRVMDDLRASLTATAQRIMGPTVRSVLITSIVRQDI